MTIIFNKRAPANVEEWNFMILLQRMAKRCIYDEWVSGHFVKFTWEEGTLPHANRSK